MSRRPPRRSRLAAAALLLVSGCARGSWIGHSGDDTLRPDDAGRPKDTAAVELGRGDALAPRDGPLEGLDTSSPDIAADAALDGDGPSGPAGTLFVDGFEGGLGRWTIFAYPGDSVIPSKSIVRGGAWAATCATNTVADQVALLYVDFAPTLTIYLRFFVYPDNGFAAQRDYVNIVRVADASASGSIFNAGFTAEGKPIAKSFATQTTFFGPAGVFQPQRWHEVEVAATMGGANGVLQMWVDKVLVIDKPTVDLGKAAAVRAHVGITWQGDKKEPLTLHLDDVLIATAR